MTRLDRNILMSEDGRYVVHIFKLIKLILLNGNCYISFQISLRLDPIDSKSALVQVLVWCQIGDKPLHEPMMTDAYMRHPASMY